ncbi:MAG: LysR family transcriptional regulator, partial [Rhodocyclales bacterium]|nr:LysR family transcriptional regulator [Rhodocyclales bacterium]
MKLSALRYLVAFADEGSFSRAAERCQVSQPTLSVALQNLEADLGV